MAAKVPVPKFQKPREYIQVEPGATAGATIGKDVYAEDGKTLWVPPTPATPQSPNSTRVFWINILDVPPNVKALAETVSAGLYVVTGAGTSATRSIAAAPGETTVADGNGIAGNPTIGLADVTPTAGGSILRVAFDAKGRRSQEDTATTTDLPEGTNLYFTPERAREAVGMIPPYNFAFGDASPSIIYTAAEDAEVMVASLQIDVPFNGSGATLSLGVTGSPGAMLPTAYIDPAAVGVYESSPRITLLAGQAIILTIVPGSGASAGAGQVVVETIPLS